MQEIIIKEEDNLEEIRQNLLKYKTEDIIFSNHALGQIEMREGNKNEIIALILHPDNLVYSYSEKAKEGKTKHMLHFKISNNKTIILPVIFNRNLYIITYILRHRAVWKKVGR